MTTIHMLIVFFDRLRPLFLLLALWGWLRHRNR